MLLLFLSSLSSSSSSSSSSSFSSSMVPRQQCHCRIPCRLGYGRSTTLVMVLLLSLWLFSSTALAAQDGQAPLSQMAVVVDDGDNNNKSESNKNDQSLDSLSTSTTKDTTSLETATASTKVDGEVGGETEPQQDQDLPRLVPVQTEDTNKSSNSQSMFEVSTAVAGQNVPDSTTAQVPAVPVPDQPEGVVEQIETDEAAAVAAEADASTTTAEEDSNDSTADNQDKDDSSGEDDKPSTQNGAAAAADGSVISSTLMGQQNPDEEEQEADTQSDNIIKKEDSVNGDGTMATESETLMGQQNPEEEEQDTETQSDNNMIKKEDGDGDGAVVTEPDTLMGQQNPEEEEENGETGVQDAGDDNTNNQNEVVIAEEALDINRPSLQDESASDQRYFDKAMNRNIEADDADDDEEEEDEEEDEKDDDEIDNKDEDSENSRKMGFTDDDDDDNDDDEEEDDDDQVTSGAAKVGRKEKKRILPHEVDPVQLSAQIQKIKQRQKQLGHRLFGGGRKNQLKSRLIDAKLREMDETPDTPGATHTMDSHNPSSTAYTERQKEMLRYIAAKKGTRAAEKLARRWKLILQSKGTVKLPFKKEVTTQRLVEHVPLVKRAFAVSAEEELILDTTLSLVHGLHYGVFSKNAGAPLTPLKKEALRDWLDLLSATLPEEWGIHDLIETLRNKINFISEKDENLKRVIATYKIKRRGWSPSCQKQQNRNVDSGNGFNCGFWKLLHTMSIGLAQHRGGRTLIASGMRKPTAAVFSPAEAADVVKRYMKHFFLCDKCTEHFLRIYNDCENNHRCDRLAVDAFTATDADWKEMGKWLWELHNDINIYVGLQQKQQAAAAEASAENEWRGASAAGKSLRQAQQQQQQAQQQMSTIAFLWPSMDDCLKCYAEDGSSWNEDAVFLYLELEYWPDHVPDEKMARLLQFEEGFLYQSFYYNSWWWGFALFVCLSLAGIALGYVFIQNRIALKKAILDWRTRLEAATAAACDPIVVGGGTSTHGINKNNSGSNVYGSSSNVAMSPSLVAVKRINNGIGKRSD